LYFKSFVICGLFLGSILTLPVQAQTQPINWYGQEYQFCAGAGGGSTLEIVSCVDGLVRKWDRRLNVEYRQAMNVLIKRQRKRLRAAQRLWIKYRNANCNYYASGEGTIARIEGVECMRVLTARRALELSQVLKP